MYLNWLSSDCVNLCDKERLKLVGVMCLYTNIETHSHTFTMFKFVGRLRDAVQSVGVNHGVATETMSPPFLTKKNMSATNGSTSNRAGCKEVKHELLSQ